MNMKLGSFGTRNGVPAIQWWRYGEAAKGEPPVVTVVTEYPDTASRDAVVAGVLA